MSILEQNGEHLLGSELRDEKCRLYLIAPFFWRFGASFISSTTYAA